MMATIETRQRADGTTAYRVRYRLKPGANPTVDTFETAGEAAQFAHIVDRIGGEAARAKRHAAHNASTHTITDALDAYIESAPDITTATAREYERALARSGLKDTLGFLPIDLVEKQDIEKWARRRLTDTSKRNGQPISPTTVRSEYGVLTMALRHAVERGWITHNPAAGIRLPKSDKSELEILTDQEFLTLHDKMTDRYKPLVWLLAATGLRWGEATALQWRDITGTQITVRQAWKHGDKSHHRVLGAPKTQKGRRRIETTPAVIASLGARGAEGSFVFTAPDGGPVTHSHFYPSHWMPACKDAGLIPVPPIHGLRHFAASHMLAAGADIFEVSRALGHSNIAITSDTYGHLVPSRTRPTAVHAARLDALRATQIEA